MGKTLKVLKLWSQIVKMSHVLIRCFRSVSFREARKKREQLAKRNETFLSFMGIFDPEILEKIQPFLISFGQL